MRKITVALSLLIAFTGTAFAEPPGKGKPPGGPPPMLIATSTLATGTATPTATFVGTLFFARSARVAAESDGLIRDTDCEEGHSVKRGARLAQLDDALLKADIEATRANLEQTRLEQAQAQRDHARVAALFEQAAVAAAEHELSETRSLRLDRQVAVLQARLDRQRLEHDKLTVRAPFAGVMVSCPVERGEWVKAGSTVATVADNRQFEALVDVPETILGHVSPGTAVPLHIAATERTGKILSVVPKGDVATRSFSIRIGLDGDPALVEGMEVRATLPSAPAKQGLVVPRDALVDHSGRKVIFLVEDGKARLVPVEVTGLDGLQAGIRGEGLEVGQAVAVKGNERLRDGQAVRTGD